MAEREVLINKAKVEYEGLFSVQDLLDIFREFMRDKQYIYTEKSQAEAVRKEGKFLKLEVALTKKLTDYAQCEIVVKTQLSEMKEKVVDVDGKKRKMFEGKVLIIFDGVLRTDYENRWETKPIYYFLRTVLERYVYTPYIAGFREKVTEDTQYLMGNIKSYLNLQKFL